MTKPEIFVALNLIRNTVIAAHVQINEALDQLEKLQQRIQQDIEKEGEEHAGDKN